MRKFIGIRIILITLLPFLGVLSWGDEFCVETSAELQNALTAAASNGKDDIIKVVRGTYIGNFVFDSYEGKSLSLLGGYSSNCTSRILDPANTILDGNFLGRVLFLNNASAGDLYVEGFKIRRGNTLGNGGGIYAASFFYGMVGNITITDNILLDNTAAKGSGIFAFTSDEGDVLKTSVRDKTATSIVFPGIYRRNDEEIKIETNGTGDILISNNKIKHNNGEGIHVVTGGDLSGGFISIQNNLIVRNSGRGIVANSFAGNIKIDSNFISKNTSLTSGGGIYARGYVYLGSGGNITLLNNIITENSSIEGGGLYALADGYGVAGSLDLINNTITENMCSNSGGGIYLDGQLDSILNLYNNIIWGNTAPTGADITLVFDPANWAESFGFNNNYSVISGNWTHSGKDIDANPLFVATGDQDYHLQSFSPCIDKGTNQAPFLPDKDYDGEPRIYDGDQDNKAIVDIGADEFIGIPLQNLSIESSSGGSTNPAPGQYVFTQGTKVQITAIPENLYRFLEWTGNIPATKKQKNPLFLTMRSDKSIKAHFTRIIYPPSNVTGQKVMNRSLSQVEYINVLKWSANSNNQDLGISKYRIYLMDGESQTLLVELNSNTFEHWHRGVTKGGIYRYAIYAVDASDKEGDPAYITVQ